jgi:hypothetical protein
MALTAEFLAISRRLVLDHINPKETGKNVIAAHLMRQGLSPLKAQLTAHEFVNRHPPLVKERAEKQFIATRLMAQGLPCREAQMEANVLMGRPLFYGFYGFNGGGFRR